MQLFYLMFFIYRVQNYSKMILLYGMNCIEAKVGKIILPLFPRMLFDNSINEADLLGDALLDHMSCTKASLLLHIGCGYGITTLKLSRVLLQNLKKEQICISKFASFFFAS